MGISDEHRGLYGQLMDCYLNPGDMKNVPSLLVRLQSFQRSNKIYIIIRKKLIQKKGLMMIE